jgi:hypothetical protein
MEIHAPVVGDWNGDGMDTVGVVRSSDRERYRWLHRTENRADRRTSSTRTG